jgi:hypothetical protein
MVGALMSSFSHLSNKGGTMKSFVSILLGLLCFILYAESRVNGQALVPSKEAAMRSTTDGPSLGALKRHSPSVIVQRVAVLTDSALPAGAYTVGQTGWFPTIDSAFAKLTRDGILGGVTLTLIDTLYQAQPGRRFELGQVAGAGPSARVTIRPAVNTGVTIRGDSNAVLTFTNVKYLTLDGRSNPPSSSAGITVHAIYNPASGWNDCVEAWGDADYNQFLYLTIKSDDFRNVSPGGGDCIVLGSLGTSMTPDSNLVEGNLMSGVFGVYVSAWTTPPGRPRGNIIRGNTYGQITDLHGAWGIQSEICEGTLTEGNTVQYMRGTFLTTNNGHTWTIGINAYGDLNTTIRNNVIHAVYTSNAAELYGILGSGTPTYMGTGLLIYNNMVYDLQNNSTTGNACIEGINLWQNVNNQILYNTVYLSGTGANPIGVDALCLWTSVTNTTLRNNIFVNMYRQTSGPGSTALWANGIFTSDYNDLCADTAFGNSYTAWLNSYYRTFSNWQGAGYDQHSVSGKPVFAAPHLHINTNFGALLDGHATPITGITTDFDGETRNPSTPDIGADEFILQAVDERGGGLPTTFELSQNYPNPFNPGTNFQFSIANRRLTILKVYDVLGREVATLVNEVKQPGTYTVQWDASRQASGVYFYQLSAGSFVDTKKFVLVK